MSITVDQEDHRLSLDELDVLAGRICAWAAQQAQATCQLLELVGEFDAGGGINYAQGAKSIAHWISHTCSLSPGVGREYVRVARAMRQMPIMTAAFRAGELSYSKVRAMTRVVDLVDESELCEQARIQTASQLQRTIAGYRTASGTRIAQEENRRLQVQPGDDHYVRITGKLPVEEGGIVDAALRLASDLHAAPPDQPCDPYTNPPATSNYGMADGFLDICRHYFATAGPTDDSGEDRHQVIIEVAAEQLARLGQPDANVAAATSPTLHRQVCSVRGIGGIEPATANRLICAGTVLGAVIDAHGDVLALGRTRRLVSKVQRRALMVRDKSCQFPECTRTTHLEAHHTTPWSHGGRTDLDDLVLVCRFHHMTIHEGGLIIRRANGTERWQFALPDGKIIANRGGWPWSPHRLINEITRYQNQGVDHVDSYDHPDARKIQPNSTANASTCTKRSACCSPSRFKINKPHDLSVIRFPRKPEPLLLIHRGSADT